MYRLSAVTFIIFFQLFYTVACSDFGVWRRQDDNNNSSSPSESRTSSSAIIDALNENGIPSQCDPECIPPYNNSITCKDPTCECNDGYEKSLFDCYLCAGDVLQASFDTVQAKIDELNEKCFAAGFNLTKLTFPGENSSRIVAPPTSSVSSFTLVLPTTVAPTPVQGINSHSQVTQGTEPTSVPEKGSPEPESQSPVGLTTSDGIKALPIEIAFSISIGLMLMGIPGELAH
ncbi:hypothetical protein Clacol_009106 [Clathrus columnatus]|uniref:Extracellular membrane protein CFEM domain-containing protein n=1 Tax=Clathrus columnatus TaxID=1419009 RepID=A0AAV5AMU8_9AGAM|nr:hypothetical protein Clacol_009106 [Clathrus columnatus]